MKRLTVIAALLLTGCGQMTPAIDTGAIGVVVKQVQSFTVKLCSFLPTDGTIVEIIKATQGGETAYAIAAAVCKAVTAMPTMGAQGSTTAPCPLVAGVCVEGQFVDPKEYEKMKDDPIPEAVPPSEEKPAPAPAAPAPGGQ